MTFAPPGLASQTASPERKRDPCNGCQRSAPTTRQTLPFLLFLQPLPGLRHFLVAHGGEPLHPVADFLRQLELPVPVPGPVGPRCLLFEALAINDPSLVHQ